MELAYLDMAAAFLDALDIQYELFVEEDPADARAPLSDQDESERAPLQ